MPPLIRASYLPPTQDAPEAGRLILRDGASAQLRLARPDDGERLLGFFRQLSAESLYRRFFSGGMPSPGQVASWCDSSHPRVALTLLVLRTQAGEPHVIATGSYFAEEGPTAEVAFAVDDAFQGKGLGTLLLERLALLAVQHGFTRFWAVTQADNRAMRDVFQESGFEVQEKLAGGGVEVDLSLLPTANTLARLELRERVATVASLRPFFRPASVAVIGASRDPSSIGHRILEALKSTHFHGPVYPVNPRATVVAGSRAYPSARELPEPVDLAVVAAPSDAVLGIVDDCAARGIRALLVISAGFAEVGPAGKQLQQQLVDKVRGHGMRLIGPNCLGLLNTDPAVRLNATFTSIFPPPGRVAMSSQSGAIGLAVLAAARQLQLGLSTFVSVGNKADVSSNDLLQYWEEDDGTDVILLYLESFGNPRRFAPIARRVARRKPIVALKSGRTVSGGRAAGSHTAALANSDSAVEALFHQTGVIRAETLAEMFDLAALLSCQPLPGGRRVAIVTNAGGPAILAADACETGGLRLPEFSEACRARLASFLPAAASKGNPVDMIASATPEQYRQAVETVLTASEVDAVIVIYTSVTPLSGEAVLRAIGDGVNRARAAGARSQPVLTCVLAGEHEHNQLDLGSERIPCFAFPEAAARVLAKAATYAEWVSQPPGVVPDFADQDLAGAREICSQALTQRGAGWLSAQEARAVFTAGRLPLAPGGIAATAPEAVELARRIGFPVAVKLASRQIVHKTEAGGVHLNLADAAAVQSAFEAIRSRLNQEGRLDALEGVVVQPMLSGGVEVMIGMTHDRLFGPLIAFGLGGIHVEILGDVCFRVAPLTDLDAAEMVRSIRGYRLLQGYRGHPAADLEAIHEVLLRVSQLVEEVPAIQELDLNPVFARPAGQGCCIVDARIRVGG